MTHARYMPQRSADGPSTGQSEHTTSGAKKGHPPIQLGIFAKTFLRPTFAGVLEAVTSHGLNHIHFNFACAGLPSMPDEIAPERLSEIRRACDERQVVILGISATFNMIDPDTARRAAGLRRLAVIARAAHRLGCPLVSLCTGTRDRDNLWQAHPENQSPPAWRDLLESMAEAIRVAEEHAVSMGIEPEGGNVVNSARRARRLLDELRSPRLKIILDPANLPARRQDVGASMSSPGRTPLRDAIDEAFQLLGGDIAMAHAKEVAPDGSMGHVAPGQGVMEWDCYLEHLQRIHFPGGLIMHGLPESGVASAVKFLQTKIWTRTADSAGASAVNESPPAPCS